MFTIRFIDGICIFVGILVTTLIVVGIEKATRVDVREYVLIDDGLICVDGMLVVEGVRENTETVIETNDAGSQWKQLIHVVNDNLKRDEIEAINVELHSSNDTNE